MHDYFDILGVSRNAGASEIRRACRHARPTHPDVRDSDARGHGRGDRAAGSGGTAGPSRGLADGDGSDAAIDFVDVSCLVDGMRDAFFRDTTRRKD